MWHIVAQFFRFSFLYFFLMNLCDNSQNIMKLAPGIQFIGPEQYYYAIDPKTKHGPIKIKKKNNEWIDCESMGKTTNMYNNNNNNNDNNRQSTDWNPMITNHGLYMQNRMKNAENMNRARHKAKQNESKTLAKEKCWFWFWAVTSS